MIICPREDDLQATGQCCSYPEAFAVVEKRASMEIPPAGTSQFLGPEGKEVLHEQLVDAKKQDSSGERSIHEGSVVESGDNQGEAQSRHRDNGDRVKDSVQEHPVTGMQLCVCVWLGG